MKRTTIYLDESKLNKLREYCYKNKLSMSDTIRTAVDKLIDEKEIKKGEIGYKDIIGIAEGSESNNISEKVEDFLKDKFKK